MLFVLLHEVETYNVDDSPCATYNIRSGRDFWKRSKVQELKTLGQRPSVKSFRKEWILSLTTGSKIGS